MGKWDILRVFKNQPVTMTYKPVEKLINRLG